MKKLVHFLAVALLLSSVKNTNWVLAGELVGRVVDRSSGEPVIGANVIVRNSQRGSASDLDGEFVISGLPEGRYTLDISHTNYQDTTLSGLRISNEERLELALIKLQQKSVVLEEVVYKYQRPTDLISIENRISGDVAGELEAKALPFRGITSEVYLLTMNILTSNNFSESIALSSRMREARILSDYHKPRSIQLFESVLGDDGERYEEEALYFLAKLATGRRAWEYANRLARDYPGSPYLSKLESIIEGASRDE